MAISRLTDDNGTIVDSLTATALTPVLLGEIYGVPTLTTTSANCSLLVKDKILIGIVKDTGHAWRAGDTIFWSLANSNATRTPGPYILGTCVTDVGASTAVGDVMLNCRVGRLAGASVADSAAVTAQAETAFDKTVVIPAAFLVDGAVFRIRGMVFHTTFTGTETAIIKVKIADGTNTTILAQSATFDGASSDLTVFDVMVTVRTDGSSGTLVSSGMIGIGAPAAGAVVVSGVASSTIDTTAANTISVTSTNSSTGESALLRQLVVERIL